MEIRTKIRILRAIVRICTIILFLCILGYIIVCALYFWPNTFNNLKF